MLVKTQNGDVFEVSRDIIDVTMFSRPDTAWTHTDASGHVHRWHVGRKVATSYDPRLHYHVPNMNRVVDVPATDDEPAQTHYECRKCGEHIRPGYTSDTTRQYVSGIARCAINGQSVSAEEFERRLKAAYPA